MAYSIVINGIDRTTDIENRTPVVNDILNDQINSLDLTLIDRSGNGFPSNDQEIIITLPSGQKEFGGYIEKNVKQKSGNGVVMVQLHCVDYTRLLDRNLVHKSYESMTDKEIIEDVVATYCSGLGITTTNVIESATIDQISFNYIQPSQVFRKLADLTGNNWYIDYDKDVHFFPQTTNPAPFNITDTSTNYKELSISNDNSQLKNRIYVRGGTKLSDFTTYSFKGDGAARKFPLPDKPHDNTVTVNGVSKTLGIKNVNLTGFDFYLNFEEKYLEQDSGAVVLGTADTVVLTYKYDIPILVAQENTASILANGVHEFAIFDKTIATTDAARDRAIAELTDYATGIIEGSFTTIETGFISGQYITINLTEYGINAEYIVQKVIARSLGAGSYEYAVSIASAKTMGIIRFLIELLEANRNLIELDDQEVVDELFSISDALASDSLLDSLIIDSAGPYATWCPDSVSTSPATRARWDLFQWG
jgi:hypothetical protein